MSILEAFNFLEIQNGKDADRAARKLDDLKDEAAHMQRAGLQPKSWYEFKQGIEVKKPNVLANVTIGAGATAAIMGGIGLIIGTATAAVPLAISGLFVGGMLGGYHNTENSRRLGAVDAYEGYLNHYKEQATTMILAQQRAHAHAHTHQPSMDGAGNSVDTPTADTPGSILEPIAISHGVNAMFPSQQQ